MAGTKPTSKVPVGLRVAPTVVQMVDELQEWIHAPSKAFVWEAAIIRWHAQEQARREAAGDQAPGDGDRGEGGAMSNTFDPDRPWADNPKAPGWAAAIRSVVIECPACRGQGVTLAAETCTLCGGHGEVDEGAAQDWQDEQAADRRRYEADDGQITHWDPEIGGEVTM